MGSGNFTNFFNNGKEKDDNKSGNAELKQGDNLGEK